MGLLESTTAGGYGIGFLLAGAITALTSVRVTFAATAVGVILATILMATLLRRSPPRRSALRDAWRRVVWRHDDRSRRAPRRVARRPARPMSGRTAWVPDRTVPGSSGDGALVAAALARW